MAYHHVALATRDLAATHRFYTEAMGFSLVKAVVAPTDGPGGWAKHVFYETGGDGLLAFWDLHDERFADFDPRISEGLGLPTWVNHLAFAAPDLPDLEARREHWLDMGIDVVEVDHGFCVSIYATDPNGILVEWCTDTRALTEADRDAALVALDATSPELEAAPLPTIHRGRRPAVTGAG
jgi:catechol 2,3-dioxygenase-like lactoylglutathione lyase family enzyme